MNKNIEEINDKECKDTCSENGTCEDGVCECLEGFIGDGITCEDKDECITGEHICGDHSKCKNIFGAYHCVCDPGFLATEDGCADDNECLKETALCGEFSLKNETTDCINVIGSYECKCKNGFFGNPGTVEGCIDINECISLENVCGAHSKCINKPGGFNCECDEGYEKEFNNSTSCVDMNECLHNPCHSAAKCTNLPGTFNCECNEGFIGDGVECKETILYSINNINGVISLENINNSIKEITLQPKLTIFGNEYDKMFISSNGIISFGDKKDSFNELIKTSVAFIPLYQNFNFKEGGNIYIKKLSSNEESSKSFIQRSDYNIYQRYNDHLFKTENLYVITYENVMNQLNKEPFIFQVIIASGNNKTYLTMLYEEIGKLDYSTNRGKAGIFNKGEFYSLVGDVLISKSNIKQPGKWIFRVDEGKLSPCPIGSKEAPYCTLSCDEGFYGKDCKSKCNCADNIPCDTITGYCANLECNKGFMGPDCQVDVDECETGEHECHKAAYCTNKVGSYECHCPMDMTGDGIYCNAINPCYEVYGRNCSTHGTCINVKNTKPTCACLKGYIGNGFECVVPLTTKKEIESTTISNIFIKKLTTPPSTLTFSVNTTIPINGNDINELQINGNAITNGVPIKIEEKTHTLIPLETTKVFSPKLIVTSTIKPKMTEKDAEILLGGVKASEMEGTFNVLLFICTIVFAIIWIVVAIAVIATCCQRHSRSHRQKYDTTVMHNWSATTATQAAYTSPRNNNYSSFAYT
uniref:EGF-like domain-containing protein n=1 Tax=Parastrongyloides trichosuri TaxID=131310 RepID=A0A0N4ZX93_PARTI